MNDTLDEVDSYLCLQTLEEGLEELEYFLGKYIVIQAILIQD